MELEVKVEVDLGAGMEVELKLRSGGKPSTWFPPEETRKAFFAAADIAYTLKGHLCIILQSLAQWVSTMSSEISEHHEQRAAFASLARHNFEHRPLQRLIK